MKQIVGTYLLCFVFTALLGCATAPNTCLVDATVKEAQVLQKAGLFAQKIYFHQNDKMHAVCFYVDAHGRSFFYDRQAGGSVPLRSCSPEIARWEIVCWFRARGYQGISL